VQTNPGGVRKAKMTQNIQEVELHYKRTPSTTNRPRVVNSADVVEVFRAIYDVNKIEHREMMYAMYLNRNNVVLGVLLISEGGTSATVCDPKIVFQGALKLNASAVILSHNHPSGNLTPSHADIQLTNRLTNGGKILDVQILDHVILTADSYYSFADNGMM
jgi:DNA repair protein RadC